MKISTGRSYLILFITVALFFSVLIFARGTTPAMAGGIPSDPPERKAELIISTTANEWWLIRWSDNALQCKFLVEYEGFPDSGDILSQCGETLFEQWIDTQPCAAITEKKDPSTCAGVYLHFVAPKEIKKSVVVNLPVPKVWLNLAGCNPIPPENHCVNLPQLVITAEEPLPNEKIENIQGIINGQIFLCMASECTIPLSSTTLTGTDIVFWAKSSYGDESERFTARVRVIPTQRIDTASGSGWFVDVISTQWLGQGVEHCAQLWEAFPSVGAPPDWLSTFDQVDQLASNQPYMYLAGQLISSGAVDASACANNGLESNGYASACGLETARNDVDIWQDRFDAQIIATAQESGIPAQLIKNLFATESQFWPGASLNWIEEFGLGHLSSTGTDSVLLWNTEFFQQFCPLVLSDETCQKGYAHLDEDEQALLRGAVIIKKADAQCATCSLGIDLDRTDFSIDLFAQTLSANCEQVGQMVYNTRGEVAGKISSYEDLWRFTLANYYAGPGCVAHAIQFVPFSQPLTWEHVAPELDSECPWASEYVNKITR